MPGKFIGIGVGPGDEDLITIKAVNTLKEVDIIVCPESKMKQGSIAYNTAEKYISQATEKLYLEFPMIHDKAKLNEKWNENADIIGEKIKENKNVAFLTLGDPTVFSTYMYLVPLLKMRGIEVETIPGITSFCAVASKVSVPLTTWEETLAIVPLKKGCQSAIEALDNFDNVVIMKPSHDSKKLGEELIKRGLEDKFILISKCSTDEEKIVTDINQILEDDIPYLSTMIVKRKGL